MQFSEGFVKVNPGCGCDSFAVPKAQYDRWNKIGRNGRGPGWYCPYCRDCRCFVGESETDRLQRELERERDRVEAIQHEKYLEEERRRETEKRYYRMRDRVKNGVCPCCNRQFQNLLSHMRRKHPDFGNDKTLKTVRLMFGLTQAALSDEIGVPEPYISHYENNRPLPPWAREVIEGWLAA